MAISLFHSKTHTVVLSLQSVLSLGPAQLTHGLLSCYGKRSQSSLAMGGAVATIERLLASCLRFRDRQVGILQ
jgi:hypothetical protein